MDDHEGGQQSGSGPRRSRRLVLSLALALAVAPVALSLFLTLQRVYAYGPFLANGGFEDGTVGWHNSYGSTFVTVTSPVWSGNWAASLTRSDTAGEIDIHQDVRVFAGSSYTLTGWIYENEAAISRVCLRIEWHDSQWPPQEDCLSGDVGYYRPITIAAVTAPPDTSTARIMVVAVLLDAAPPNPAYFDEILFTSNMMPVGYVPLVQKDCGG
jgi:hypothetical protein